jgi:N utilization substance protein B
VEASVGKRRKAREMAIQMLYQAEVGDSPLAQVLELFEVPHDGDGDEGAADAAAKKPVTSPAALAYARKLASGTVEHGDQIDELIRRHAENWRLERMPAIDRNILRLAIYEMLFERKVPKIVIVDEAIELAKKFGSEHSSRFVNGLLDGVLKSEQTAVEGSAGEA